MAVIPHYDDSIRVRPADAGDLEAARRVGTRAFNCNSLDWYTETPLVGETADGRVVSALALTIGPMYWGAAEIPASAVGGVATDPSEQGKGYAGGMIVATVHHMRELGLAVCPLWPFSFRYYRKFGWELTCLDRAVDLWPNMSRAIGGTPDGVRPAAREDAPAMHAAHTRAARLTNGQSVRSEAWWTEQGDAFYANALVHEDGAGTVDGYALYEGQNRPYGQGKRYRVQELQAADIAVQRSLLAAVADLPEVVEAHVVLPADTLLLELAPERLTVQQPMRLMIRVLDVARALAHLKPAADASGRIAFEVRDWIVSRDKPIAVTATIDGGHVDVKPGCAVEPVRCDIATFARLYSGGLSIDRACALGLVDAAPSAARGALEAITGGRAPFRSDKEPG